MKRQTWTDLSAFAAIADCGSFTKAAATLNVSPSALSHSMRAMEKRLGVRLLNRSTRSVVPTDAGQRLLEKLRPAIRDLNDTLSSLDEERATPCGRVRVSAHRTAAMFAIAPRLGTFARQCPEVQVEIEVEDGLVDIVAQGFDAGVRHEHVLDRDMISLRISEPSRSVYVASPDYWRRHPQPRQPKDLLGHRCVAYRLTSSGALLRWRFERGEERFFLDPPAVLISNDVDLVVEAALGGVGVAWLLERQVSDHLKAERLSAVLTDYSAMIPPNYLYYPSRRQMTAALRAFIDVMKP